MIMERQLEIKVICWANSRTRSDHRFFLSGTPLINEGQLRSTGGRRRRRGRSARDGRLPANSIGKSPRDYATAFL